MATTSFFNRSTTFLLSTSIHSTTTPTTLSLYNITIARSLTTLPSHSLYQYHHRNNMFKGCFTRKNSNQVIDPSLAPQCRTLAVSSQSEPLYLVLLGVGTI